MIQLTILILSILILCGIITNLKAIGITFFSLSILWIVCDILIAILKTIKDKEEFKWKE